MIRYRGSVVYADGRREEFETGLRGARAWERYALRHELPINPRPETIDHFPVRNWALVIAHAALRVELGVDAWEELLDDVDVEAIEVPPTPPDRSNGSSSSSLSPSAVALPT